MGKLYQVLGYYFNHVLKDELLSLLCKSHPVYSTESQKYKEHQFPQDSFHGRQQQSTYSCLFL